MRVSRLFKGVTTLFGGLVAFFALLTILTGIQSVPELLDAVGITQVSDPEIPEGHSGSLIGLVVCPGTLPLSVESGTQARVRSQTIKLYEKAGGGKSIGELGPDTILSVIGGPQCSAKSTWWEVRIDSSGQRGWIEEADNKDYLIERFP